MSVFFVRLSWCFAAALSLLLVGVLVACSGSTGDDDDAPCSAEPCGGEPDVQRPTEGSWEVSGGVWTEDEECGAAEQFYAPSQFEIWNATDADFEFSVLFSDDPDAGQTITCTLSAASFACDAAEEDIQMGDTEILMTSVITGSFENTGTGAVSFSLEMVCTEGCGALQGTWPCHAVWQSNIAISAR